MIIEAALHLAGPGAVPVRRPRGVVHVYVGRLTRSGRAVPATGRPVCGIRTRRLRVLGPGSSLHPLSVLVRLCARCARVLERRRPAPRVLRTREEYRAAHATTTLLQLAHDAELAETAEELDAVAHLSLALFGHLACVSQPVNRPNGRTLHALLEHLRSTRFHDERAIHAAEFTALLVEGTDIVRAHRRAAWREREERIARLGINLAVPTTTTRSKP